MNTINISFMVEITKVSLWFTIETQQCIDHWSACSIRFLDRQNWCEKKAKIQKRQLKSRLANILIFRSVEYLKIQGR
jgi:hypothetical protein